MIAPEPAGAVPEPEDEPEPEPDDEPDPEDEPELDDEPEEPPDACGLATWGIFASSTETGTTVQ